MINTLITEEQIKKVLKINSCLKPEQWNKGMYDSFMVGVELGKTLIKNKEVMLKKENGKLCDIIIKSKNLPIPKELEIQPLEKIESPSPKSLLLEALRLIKIAEGMIQQAYEKQEAQK